MTSTNAKQSMESQADTNQGDQKEQDIENSNDWSRSSEWRKSRQGKQSMEIRSKINHRERRRMQDLNVAMDALREVMPYANGPSVRKLSKIATLSLARNYIQMLTKSVEELKHLLDEAYRSRGPYGPYHGQPSHHSGTWNLAARDPRGIGYHGYLPSSSFHSECGNNFNRSYTCCAIYSSPSVLSSGIGRQSSSLGQSTPGLLQRQ